MGGTVSEQQWRDALRAAIKEHAWSEGQAADLTRALQPHFEAAHARGVMTGRSKAGYRLVQENETLRRELALAQQTKRREGVCPSCLSALSVTESGASAGEAPEGASP